MHRQLKLCENFLFKDMYSLVFMYSWLHFANCVLLKDLMMMMMMMMLTCVLSGEDPVARTQFYHFTCAPSNDAATVEIILVKEAENARVATL